ncbi:MAG: glycosyltransferase family 2 protein [Lentisphaeria bacterium]
MPLSDLTIIIPCYNEKNNIPISIPPIIDFCKKKNCHLIIVNDGSKDDSLSELKKLSNPCMKIISHKVNCGYGAAIQTGVKLANSKYVVTIDADGQHKLENIEKLYNKAISENADMVVGERQIGKSEASFYRLIGKFCIRLTISMLMKNEIKDTNSGMKLYSREIAIKLFPLCPKNMSYSDIILLLFLHYKCRVSSVPITINPRTGGVSTINTFTAINSLYEMGLIIMLFHPLKVFSRIAVLFATIGVIWAIRCYLISSILSAISSTLFAISTIIFFDGIIIEQICRHRKQMIDIKNYIQENS